MTDTRRKRQSTFELTDTVGKQGSTTRDHLEIPELKREQLGVGARGKYLERFARSSNVAVLRPEIHEAFPTSEAVNKAVR